MQQRLFDIGWSDESKCQACHKEKGSETHRFYQLTAQNVGVRSERRSQKFSESESRKPETSKKELKWQRGIVDASVQVNESLSNQGHFRMKKWESEEHKSWGLPA